MKTRTISVGYMARVEGETALTVKLKGDEVTSVSLSIFEPPRLFESMLVGRSPAEAPDITARICGICPVAYQMSACAAVENVFRLAISNEIRALRRLLYCGEWIESHVLHMVMLHAPDFLNVPDAAALSKLHPERVKGALKIKKTGNALVAKLGGREIHPINVKIGGFYRAPLPSDLTSLLPDLQAALGEALEMLGWMAGFHYPDAKNHYLYVALRHPTDYPMNEGRIVSSEGLDIDVSEYDRHFTETHETRSHALHTTHQGKTMFCGPLARLALNFEKLPPIARDAALGLGLDKDHHNPFKSLLARGVEVVFALDEAIRIIENYKRPSPSFIAIDPALSNAPTRPEASAGPSAEKHPSTRVGYGATEAPRGILYHRYEVGDDGLITNAKIVPPTSQNQRVIEEDLFRMGKLLSTLPKAEARAIAEQAIRNYDPCISCATHFLDLRFEQTE